MIHDRPHHLAQRRITYLLRCALGDLFLGPYGRAVATVSRQQLSSRIQALSGEGPEHVFPPQQMTTINPAPVGAHSSVRRHRICTRLLVVVGALFRRGAVLVHW